MLMQFDSFRGELDRLAEQIMSGARPPRPCPMDAYRRGDEFVVAFDLPADGFAGRGERGPELRAVVHRLHLPHVLRAAADHVAVTQLFLLSGDQGIEHGLSEFFPALA